MTAGQQVATFIAVIVCFAVSIIVTPRDRARIPLVWIALGLALWALVPLAAAWKAA